jgi:hypothetical protein
MEIHWEQDEGRDIESRKRVLERKREREYTDVFATE